MIDEAIEAWNCHFVKWEKLEARKNAKDLVNDSSQGTNEAFDPNSLFLFANECKK